MPLPLTDRYLGTNYIGADSVGANKPYLDKHGKRLDGFGYGYQGIVSRVQPRRVVVAALGHHNTRLTGRVSVLLMPDEAAYHRISKLHNNGFLAWYALKRHTARRLGLH